MERVDAGCFERFISESDQKDGVWWDLMPERIE